jgi:hypothetical protein
MAEYEHHACTIVREPVPVQMEGVETTGWKFTVQKDGYAIPVEVTAIDRKLGLRETRKRIDRYVADAAAVARVGDLQSLTQPN